MSTVPIFAPDGSLGDIPAGQLAAAVKAGAKPGVHITAPDGSPGVIPADRIPDAAKAGAKVVPIEDQPVQHPGFWATMVSDLGSMAKGLIQPTHTADETTESAAAKMAAPGQTEKAAGYSVPYRSAAALTRGFGIVDPSGMEQSAAQGDVGGVAGHAAAAAVPVVAGAAAGEAAGALGKVDVKPMLAKTARFASDIVDPRLTGIVSPRLAYAQKALGKLADVMEAKPSMGELDATGENIPYAGAARQKPEILDATGENKPFAGGMDELAPAASAPAAAEAPVSSPPAAAAASRSVVIDPATGTPEFSDVLAAKPKRAPAGAAVGARNFKAIQQSQALRDVPQSIVDTHIPASGETAGLNQQVKSDIDLHLANGDVMGAESALDQGAKMANPKWQPPDRPRITPSVQNMRENLAQVKDAEAAPNRATPDSADDRAISQEMNWDLERHGWMAESEARREFIARNSTGITKSDLIAGAPKSAETPAAADLTPEWQAALDAALKKKAAQ